MQMPLADGGSVIGGKPIRKSDLSPERRRLLVRMQDLDRGKIQGLVVRDCEPQRSPRPLISRDVVIGERSRPRPERARANFTLKGHLTELFEEFDRAPDGTTFTIFVQDGLPVRFRVEELDRD